MPSIFIKDDLRASVEAASGGRQTVLYTALGQPTFMNVIPQFSNESVGIAGDATPHPMFYGQDGTAKSEYFFGTYPGVEKNGELLSLPGVRCRTSITHDAAVALARAAGAGHHITPNAAYAGIALWCRANGFQPSGNTAYGRDSVKTFETGRRADGAVPGLVSGSADTLTGSGPNSWNHDNSPNGIADLCGNVWEWSPGMRILNGEINIIPNNRMVISAVDHSLNSAEWKAIDGATGALVAPNTAGTVRYVGYTASTASTFLLTNTSTFEACAISAGSITSSVTINLLKSLGILPVVSGGLGGVPTTPSATTGVPNGDGLWMTLTDERLPFRLGSWNNAGTCGVSALIFNNLRDNSYVGLGVRPGFVL